MSHSSSSSGAGGSSGSADGDSSMIGQIGFAKDFSSSSASFKLFELDENLLKYMQAGGSLELKPAQGGNGLVACTGDATYTVTLVESSNAMMLMNQQEVRPAAEGTGSQLEDAKYIIHGTAPGTHELGKIAAPLHLLQHSLLAVALDSGAIEAHKERCARRRRGQGEEDVAEENREDEAANAEGRPAKRRKTAGEQIGEGEGEEEGDDNSGSSKKAKASTSGPSTGTGTGASSGGIGIPMSTLLETVPCSRLELNRGLARFCAVRVPHPYLAFLDRCGVAMADSEPEPDATAEDDDDDADDDAAADRERERDSQSLYYYSSAHRDGEAVWTLLDEEYAFSVLEAVLTAAEGYSWPLNSLPVADCVEELSSRFPRFVTRHVLTRLFSSPTATAASKGDGKAALSFNKIATVIGTRTLMQMQLSSSSSASSTSSSADSSLPLLNRFLGGAPLTVALKNFQPPQIVSALRRWEGVRKDTFLKKWKENLPTAVQEQAARGEEGEGAAGDDEEKDFNRLLVAAGLVMVEVPAAASPASSSSSSASGGAAAGSNKFSTSGFVAAAMENSASGAASKSGPTVGYFPHSFLSFEPALRFKQLFSCKPKWTLEELTPFVSPLAGNKALQIPGKTMDELLIAHTRVTNLAGGARLFSQR